jgi:hypothetical protein
VHEHGIRDSLLELGFNDHERLTYVQLKAAEQ